MPLLPDSEVSIVTEVINFRAGQYLLHGELAYPEATCARGAVVLAGPHPLLGGNMRNNVVRGLADGLAHAGFLTLRFDYRGVGRSQGAPIDVARHLAEFWRTSHAPQEIDYWQDVQGAADFVQEVAPGSLLALVGYSFGCALLPHVRPPGNRAALVLVAPTVAKHNYDAFRTVSSPLLVVASEDDFATEQQQLADWFGTLGMPRQLIRRRCDNHFFRGHENWLTAVVSQFLDETGRGLET